MKKILILTGKAFSEDLNYICLILQKKYLRKHTIETLDTMKDGDAFDYAYIIISEVTPKDELASLIRQAQLWTQDHTSIVPILFNTIVHCEQKMKQQKENIQKRVEKKETKNAPSVSRDLYYSILKHLN